jgi:hypothetical protein
MQGTPVFGIREAPPPQIFFSGWVGDNLNLEKIIRARVCHGCHELAYGWTDRREGYEKGMIEDFR